MLSIYARWKLDKCGESLAALASAKPPLESSPVSALTTNRANLEERSRPTKGGSFLQRYAVEISLFLKTRGKKKIIFTPTRFSTPQRSFPRLTRSLFPLFPDLLDTFWPAEFGCRARNEIPLNFYTRTMLLERVTIHWTRKIGIDERRRNFSNIQNIKSKKCVG